MSIFPGWYALCLTFNVLEELLLLGDEVFLLGEVRLQLSDSLLRRLQFLPLSQQVLPQRLHLLAVCGLQHPGLLLGGTLSTAAHRAKRSEDYHKG